MTPLFPGVGPHVFYVPPGRDLAAEIAAGLVTRLDGAAPQDWARVTVYVPTARLAQRLTEALTLRHAGLLPRIRLLDAIAADPVAADLPLPVSSLRRRLELARLVGAWVAQKGAPPASQVWDLTDSLLSLFDEMQAEGVSPQALRALDVSDESGHWQTALQMLTIARTWFDHAELPGQPARLRQAVDRLDRAWRRTPPDGPVLVAGSTGSRGATAALLHAVARLPQGGIVLPAFDPDLPADVWAGFDDPLTGEDHAQFRTARLLARLGLMPTDVQPWAADQSPVPARARLLSLALQPPPVTDRWLAAGPGLGPVGPACDGVTYVEAASERQEAETIALRLRLAVEEGRSAALVTPDRALARRVTAALDRWGLRPDDSAGEPLSLSPPGRLLRQVAAMRGRPVAVEPLLALLKHPLVHAGSGRAGHLRRVQALELAMRDPRRAPLDMADGLVKLVGKVDAGAWGTWLRDLIGQLAGASAAPAPLAHHVAAHIALAETAARGVAETGAGLLWEERSGRAARRLFDRLGEAAEEGDRLTASDYRALIDHLLGREIARDRDDGHPQIRIRGLQEWRADSADLVILGGLSEGIWPARPAVDPWLNRRMRHALGLPIPDRETGLAALDFWHAVQAPEIWITRARRRADGPVTPARWLDRIEGLLSGLGQTGGRAALSAMRARGDAWLARSAALARPMASAAPAPRPSPAPPPEARPLHLSVTELVHLNRDPYRIYARRILALQPLDPLTAEPDAAERGTLLHEAVAILADPAFDPGAAGAEARLMEFCEDILAQRCPWPATRRLWLGQIARIAPRLIAEEIERRAVARPLAREAKGMLSIAGITLTGRADRIDVTPAGDLVLYDYKSGAIPTKSQQVLDRQLQVLAAMAERGAFEGLGERRVQQAHYISLSAASPNMPVELNATSTTETLADLERILLAWRDATRGYTAWSLPRRDGRAAGDHDHLARRGEWDETSPPAVLRVS